MRLLYEYHVIILCDRDVLSMRLLRTDLIEEDNGGQRRQRDDQGAEHAAADIADQVAVGRGVDERRHEALTQ